MQCFRNTVSRLFLLVNKNPVMLIILYFLSQRNKFRRYKKFVCIGLSKPENVKPSLRQPVDCSSLYILTPLWSPADFRNLQTSPLSLTPLSHSSFSLLVSSGRAWSPGGCSWPLRNHSVRPSALWITAWMTQRWDQIWFPPISLRESQG